MEVRLDLDSGAGRLGFTIADRGAGFDIEAIPGGGGLQNIADRIGAVGGEVTVRSEPGGGTSVTGWVPVALASPGTSQRIGARSAGAA